jgi:uncharacterized RDD family membrane protein YckC
MTTTPPGGWYPDPSGAPGLRRWWDGTSWTEHTHMVTAPPPMPPPVQLGPPLVSYGRRLGGWLIDWLIVGVVSGVTIALSGAYNHTSATTVYSNGNSVHATTFNVNLQGLLIQAAFGMVYGTLLCGSKRGQTVGMMAVGVRAVDMGSGESIGFARALWRAFFEYLMAVLLFIPWVIDMLFPLWDPMRQCLHDKVSRTLVIESGAYWHPSNKSSPGPVVSGPSLN